MTYCHKHGQGRATGRCLICDEEVLSLGIQADKDRIAVLDGVISADQVRISELESENARLIAAIEGEAVKWDNAAEFASMCGESDKHDWTRATADRLRAMIVNSDPVSSQVSA